MTNEEKIQLLAQKLSLLSSNLEKQKTEIELIRQQLSALSSTVTPDTKTKINDLIQQIVVEKKEETAEIKQVELPKKEEPVVPQYIQPVVEKKQESQPATISQTVNPNNSQKPKFNLEEYIGSKLVSILGIIALVIGISIGVKYAIDKDLINPITRIIFGFLAGGILLTFAFIFKKKYHLFSAIILGGAVATMFFSAYAGFAFYNLYPRLFAFALMFIITAFTVFAAHSYNYEVIAIIGLVGSYMIPPLLSDGSGKMEYMFAFMSIVNAGVLVLSLLKNWNWLKYFAYGLTWIITAAWVLNSYKAYHLNMTIGFVSVFFLTFYFTFIGYKLIKKIPFKAADIASLLSNSTVYFGLGYYAFNNTFTEKYLGLFCVFNALIHMAVAYWAYSKNNTEKVFLNFLIAITLTFLTITIPVQLEGNWVTLIWFTEMLMLFIVGKRTKFEFFKKMSYCLAVFGFLSLAHDWGVYYLMNWDTNDKIIHAVVFNKMFMTTAFSLLALGALSFFHKKSIQTEGFIKTQADSIVSIIVPILLHIILYTGILFEIILYFQNWNIVSPKITTTSSDWGYDYTIEDKSIFTFMALWILIYTTCYFAIATFINSLWKKSIVVNWIFYGLSVLFIILSISTGLSGLGQLRSYYSSVSEEFFPVQFKTNWLINFRYVLFLFTVISLFLVYYSQRIIQSKISTNVFIWIFHLSILTILSSELIQQFRNYNSEDVIIYEKIARRMGFTILWAVYSLALITFGILRKIKMLRIMGFVLFGATIIKLLIDSIYMSLGYKLVVYIAVGLILMIVGFLYQRFKKILFEDDTEN